MCLFLFSLSHFKNLGMIIELDPKGRKITCPTFGLYSSPAEDSAIGHIVLDLTCLANLPKSRERSAHLKRHATFALLKHKTAYPAHSRELDEDDDDKPLVRPDRSIVSEDDDEEPLVQPSSRIESIKEKRESTAERSVPTKLRRRKGPPVWRDPSATMEKDVSGNSRERSEEVSIFGRNPDCEAFRSIINKMSDERNLRDLHLKHYHMSTAQFKKRTTYLEIPGKEHDLDQHVVKKCPFCNSTKPRADRSRVSGWRADEFGDIIFLDHGSTKIGDKSFGFLIILDGATSHLSAYPCKSASPSAVISKLHQCMDTFQISRRRCVRIWLSIIFMICRHSIECIMWRDFRLDRTLLGQIELRSAYDCSRSFSRHLWIQPPKIWTRPLCHKSHLPRWCVRQRRWETHR